MHGHNRGLYAGTCALVKIQIKGGDHMKNLFNALITGLFLSSSYCLFKNSAHAKKDIIDLKESEVKEID